MDKYALCIPADIQGILSVTASNYNHDDPMIKNCILIASTQIEKFCQRPFYSRQVSDIFTVPWNASGAFSLFASGAPIKDGSIVATENDSVSDNVTVKNLEYGTMSYAAVPVQGSYNPQNRLVKVTYTAGFEERTDLPDGFVWDGVTVLDAHADLVQACALHASYLANRFLRDNVGDQNKVTGMKAGTYSLIPEAAMLASSWVRPRYMGV